MTEDEMNRFIASLSLATPEPEFNVRNLPSAPSYRSLQPDTGMFVGGGGERDVSGDYRNVAIQPGFRAGPVSGSATVATGRDMPTPGVGYSVNTELPGGFNAGYRRMHAMEAPSRYDQHMLSLAREVLGGNVSGSVTEQDGRRGFGAGVSRPLGGGGNAFINAQRDPRGGHAIMGGMDMRFSRGGYADGGDAEVQSNGMPVISDGQVNWGDSSNAADFVRADQAMRAMRSAPAAPEPQAAPMPMQRRAPAPAPYSAPRDVPLPPVRPANLGQPVFQNSSPEGPGAYNPDDGFPARPPGQYADPAMLFDPNMMAKGFTPPLEAPSAPPPASPPPPTPPGASEWRRGSFPQEGGGKYTNRAMPLTPPAQTPPTTDELLALLSNPTKSVASAAIDQAAPVAKFTDRAAPGISMTPQQRDLIIRTIAAESSGKTPEEGQGIAHVIMNRIMSGRYGKTPERVLFAPKQFEPWADPRGSNYPMRHKPGTTKYEKAQDALDAAMGGDDITGGATLFWGPKSQAALGRPAPKWGRTGGLDIGETRFHREDGGEVSEGNDMDSYATRALYLARGGYATPGFVDDQPEEEYPDGARPLTIYRNPNRAAPAGAMDVSGDQGPSYDQMGNVTSPGRNADPIVDAAMKAIPARSYAKDPELLAQEIQDYKRKVAEREATPEYYRQMTHYNISPPLAPVEIEGGFIGKRAIGEAPYDNAEARSKFFQTLYDMKTLPLYAAGSVFPPAAGLGMALDTAEGVAAGSPTQVAMGAFGAPGKVMKYGAAPLIAATGMLSPDEAQAAKLPKAPKAATSSASLPNIRNMSVDEAMKIVRKQPHLIPSGEASEAYYIGGPRDIKNKRQLNTLRQQFDDYIAADPRGRDWYDRYRAAVRQVTGNDPVANKWMSAQHGQFSAGVSPDSELAFAIKENNASIAGMPVKAARPAQHEAHNLAIAMRDPRYMQLGEKTGEYARLINPDQAQPPGATGVNDFRHARNFKYTEAGGDAQRDALTSTQHKFLDYETALAVDRANKTQLGGGADWTGERLQAAPWVRQKALDILSRRPNLTEQHMPAQLALAKASGLEGDAAVAVARREAEKLGYESAFQEANKTIGDFFDKHTAFATHEAHPGSQTGHLPGSMTATQAEREAYASDPRSSWAFAPGDRDAMYGGLGVPGTGVNMRVRPTTQMQGAYMNPQGVLETNPGEVARPLVAFNTGDVKTVGNADRVILDTAEKVRAFLDAQNAGAWHKPWAGGKEKLSNSYFMPLNRASTPDELMSLRDAFKTQGPSTASGSSPRPLFSDVTDTGSGMTLTSFGETVPSWDKNQRREIERILSTNAPADARSASRVAVDSGYAGLEDVWPKGGGAATRDVLEALNTTPELRTAFNENPYIPQKALNNLQRDSEWSKRWGATNEAIDNARKIIGEGPGWIDRLERALKSGAVLPAIGAALLSPEVLRRAASGREE